MENGCDLFIGYDQMLHQGYAENIQSGIQGVRNLYVLLGWNGQAHRMVMRQNSAGCVLVQAKLGRLAEGDFGAIDRSVVQMTAIDQTHAVIEQKKIYSLRADLISR